MLIPVKAKDAQGGKAFNQCLLFDMVNELPGTTIFLKRLLENPNVTKVLHDCRQDAAALLVQKGITLVTVFDTQASVCIPLEQFVMSAQPAWLAAYMRMLAMCDILIHSVYRVGGHALMASLIYRQKCTESLHTNTVCCHSACACGVTRLPFPAACMSWSSLRAARAGALQPLSHLYHSCGGRPPVHRDLLQVAHGLISCWQSQLGSKQPTRRLGLPDLLKLVGLKAHQSKAGVPGSDS